VGIRQTAAKVAGVVDDAKATVSVGAAVSIAALIIATVALIVAVVKD
jgi:hypothetical protein